MRRGRGGVQKKIARTLNKSIYPTQVVINAFPTPVSNIVADTGSFDNFPEANISCITYIQPVDSEINFFVPMEIPRNQLILLISFFLTSHLFMSHVSCSFVSIFQLCDSMCTFIMINVK